jgi:hypothetical protein
VSADTVAVPAMLAESVAVPSPAVPATPHTSFRNHEAQNQTLAMQEHNYSDTGSESHSTSAVKGSLHKTSSNIHFFIHNHRRYSSWVTHLKHFVFTGVTVL